MTFDRKDRSTPTLWQSFPKTSAGQKYIDTKHLPYFSNCCKKVFNKSNTRKKSIFLAQCLRV